MGALADLTDEFKKLPTAGKVAVVGAGGAVIVLAVLAARSNAAQQAAASNSGASGTDTSVGGGTPNLSGTIAGGSTAPDTMTTLMEAQLQQILAQLGGGGGSSGSGGGGIGGGPQPPQPAPGTGTGATGGTDGLGGITTGASGRGGILAGILGGPRPPLAPPPPSGSGSGAIPPLAPPPGTGGSSSSGSSKRVPPPQPSFPKFYTVRPGDSLFSISTKYPVNGAGNWQALYKLNAGTIGANPNVIKPGQQLRLY